MGDTSTPLMSVDRRAVPERSQMVAVAQHLRHTQSHPTGVMIFLVGANSGSVGMYTRLHGKASSLMLGYQVMTILSTGRTKHRLGVSPPP
jgi:hypothetical protein